ncbi:hypothetical protein D3C76_858330 [compost metagenome]
MGGSGDRLAQLLALRVEQQAIDEVSAGALVGIVWRIPAADQLGFAQGFLLPLVQALCIGLQPSRVRCTQAQWPAAEQGLVEQ